MEMSKVDQEIEGSVIVGTWKPVREREGVKGSSWRGVAWLPFIHFLDGPPKNRPDNWRKLCEGTLYD
uniref:Uncharacterized protein n=1 Tax=Cucumis melo TaxID=3656 RepID=A0A9I9CVK1_CUCME